jgi:hypothetical protein
MRNWLKRLQIKGFVTGVLVTVLLSGTMLVVAQTVTREITYGINVMLNGHIVQFDYDNRPFVMDGRTFLPVRALAELIDLPVDFDPATNTAILGTRTAGPVRASLNTVAPFHDSSGGEVRVANVNSVAMGGTSFQNAVRYTFSNRGNSRTAFSLHNLNGQYRMFTGHMGRVDGSLMRDATVRILGDGNVLQTFEIRGGELPIEFSVFVEGIRLLRIEVTTTEQFGSSTMPTFAIVGFVE